MRNCCTNHWYFDHVFLSSFNCFTDSFWYFLSFTSTKTYTSVTVTNNHKSCKAKTTSTFNNFCNTVDGYYAFFRPRTYQTPKGTVNPLLMNYQPYVGDTYTIDPGDWTSGTLIVEGVPFIGPTLGTWMSGGKVENAEKFPPMVSLLASYQYIHCAPSIWTSPNAQWNYDREKNWAEGDKNALKVQAVVSLLRVGAPVQLYATYRDLSIIPGKNTRQSNTFTGGVRLLLKFW